MNGPLDLAPIDPLAPCVGGVYRDEVVEVHAGPCRSPDHQVVRTADFDLALVDGHVAVGHRVPLDRLDDDVAGMVRDQLFAPGWLRGGELFERVFTGVVLSSVPDPLAAWELFYRNTVARLDHVPCPGAGAHGTIADYAPVHAHAAGLVLGSSALELGSCFGFLSLRLAAAGVRTTASDVSPGTMRLLETVAPRLGVDVGVLLADAARVDAPDGCADTVLAVHLLEHLPPDHGGRVVAEAVRLAARRVVLAVPLEDDADDTWGHVRTVTLDDLHRWGEATCLPHDVHEAHGGWLVIDTAEGRARPTTP